LGAVCAPIIVANHRSIFSAFAYMLQSCVWWQMLATTVSRCAILDSSTSSQSPFSMSSSVFLALFPLLLLVPDPELDCFANSVISCCKSRSRARVTRAECSLVAEFMVEVGRSSRKWLWIRCASVSARENVARLIVLVQSDKVPNDCLVSR